MKKKTIILMAVIAIPIIAFIVNSLMLVHSPIGVPFFQAVGSYEVWIPFLGSLIGTLIAGIITIFVLSKTIEVNKETSEKNLQVSKDNTKETLQMSKDNTKETLKESRNSLSFAYEEKRLNRYSDEIANNYMVFDIKLLNRAMRELTLYNNEETEKIIEDVNSNISNQYVKFDLIFKRKKITDEEKEYFICFENLCWNFTYLILELRIINKLKGFEFPSLDIFSQHDQLELIRRDIAIDKI